ncbi:MAG: arginine--tRNA ligase [Planctomycetota bacterium]|jgi:arginyl-tRNA synthetase
MQNYKNTAALIIQSLTELPEDKIINALVTPPDPKMGDIGFPCFELAKTWKKNPAQIAAELAEKAETDSNFSKIAAVGPYLNFTVNADDLISGILSSARDAENTFGRNTIGKDKTVIIDYSSPNIAKPLAIHHIRSTIIGAALCRIYNFSGYNVEAVNHLGDWGTNFGQLMVSYKKEEAENPDKKVDISELLRLYIQFHKDAEDDESLQQEAKEWFVKLEDGDSEAVRLWELFCEESLKSFKVLYKRLGVDFDHYTGESFFNDKMDGCLAKIAEKGISEESEGALVVKLEEEGIPPCLLRKNDGSTLYATRDLAAALYRYETFKFDKCLYVVANQQELHFRQVKKVLEKMGLDWSDDMVHIKFGMLSFGGGVFEDQGDERVTGSTRKGNIVFLEDVLDKAKEKAAELLKEGSKDPQIADHIEELSEDIGLGAVIFNELAQRRMKDVIFTWDKALNLQGDSGPYLQYTHARLSSVLDKSGLELPGDIDFSPLGTPAELEVAKAIGRFPESVERALQEDEPAVISDYLLDLCSVFNRFFTDKNNHRIISDDKELTLARVGLVDCVRKTLATGLSLLGIKAPERM